MRWSRTSLVGACALAAACGDPGGRPEPGRPEGRYDLTLVGDPDLVLHPGEERSLRVVLSREEAGPIAGAPVRFEVDGDAAGARVDREVRTDGHGIATARLRAGNPTVPDEAPRIAVSAPGLDVEPVGVAFSVVLVRRRLRIVASPSTRVDPEGQSATTVIGASTATLLRVRDIDDDTGRPIAGDAIRFSKPPGSWSHWSGTSLGAVESTTGPRGEAQALLVATKIEEGPFLVLARIADGEAEVVFQVTVSGAHVLPCTDDRQCRRDERCRGGACVPDGSCGPEEPCPLGYDCVAGACKPHPDPTSCDSDAACSGGQCCDPAAGRCRDPCEVGCAGGMHCEPAALCGSGACVPDGRMPDVTGVWRTRHSFSLAHALPATLSGLFVALRALDQAIAGRLTLPGVPGWVQDAIDGFLSQLLQLLLPDWLQLLVRIGDDLGTVLGTFRAEGWMRLTEGKDLAHVQGTEVWTSLVFYWLPLCGDAIAGDPGAAPDCARIDVMTAASLVPGESPQCRGESLPSVAVEVAPFTASIAGDAPPWVLEVGRRRARVEMGKVLLVLVDRMIELATGGEARCIEETTDCGRGKACLVDCEGLGTDIADLTSGFVDAAGVQRLCREAVRGAGHAVAQALAQAWPVKAELLEFEGYARIGPGEGGACDSAIGCAERLGRDDYDEVLRSSKPEARDGAWTGSFFGAGGGMPGAWQATRD